MKDGSGDRFAGYADPKGRWTFHQNVPPETSAVFA
jgi:hypothetical protein